MSTECKECGQTTEYQGWANYETWAVKLHMDNEPSAYYSTLEQAREAKQDAPDCEQVKSGVWTVEQAARFNLADQLKDELGADGATATKRLNGLWSDLLTAALGRVDWNAIAEALLEDCEEDS
jgi:hypothetical protein